MDKNQNANYKTPHNTQTYKKGIKRKCIKQKVDMRNLLCSKHMSTKRIERKKKFPAVPKHGKYKVYFSVACFRHKNNAIPIPASFFSSHIFAALQT